jgi:hypothetical protein
MSLSISIGAARLGEDDEGRVMVVCDPADAPAGEAPPASRFHGAISTIAPSATTWADFCRRVGLFALFFSPEPWGLWRNRTPIGITPEVRAQLAQALADWERDNPDAATLAPTDDMARAYCTATLRWLVWWAERTGDTWPIIEICG